MPPYSRGFFRPREKSLILLVLLTFGFVCFGAIFFLPGGHSSDLNHPAAAAASSAGTNRVYKVYKELQEAGHEFIIPPPPIDVKDQNNPNIRHGVIDRPNPHRVDDKVNITSDK